MNYIILKLLAALLTFGIGLVSASSWTNFNCVDKKLMAAISRVQLKNIEKVCQRKSLSVEECGQMKESVNSETFARQLAQDIANADAGCKTDNLSAAGCIARKENAIRSIEETLLADNQPEPPMRTTPGVRAVFTDYGTPQQKMVLIEKLP
jgi:hypothetical protein